MTIFVGVKVALVAIASVFFVFFLLPVLFFGAPFMPSYRRKRKEILEPLFEIARTAPGGKFVDLGSGDGRVVAEFARRGFEATGIELNPFLVWWSRMTLRKLGLKNARVIHGDFFKTDLSGFDIVYFFHYAAANVFVGAKLKKELKPGSIVISAHFQLHDFNLLKKEGVFWVYKI